MTGEIVSDPGPFRCTPASSKGWALLNSVILMFVVLLSIGPLLLAYQEVAAVASLLLPGIYSRMGKEEILLMNWGAATLGGELNMLLFFEVVATLGLVTLVPMTGLYAGAFILLSEQALLVALHFLILREFLADLCPDGGVLRKVTLSVLLSATFPLALLLTYLMLVFIRGS